MTDPRPNFGLCAAASWLLLAASLGCSDATLEPDPDGTERPPAQLDIVRLPSNHPPFFNDTDSFYAKVGRASAGTISFRLPNGQRGSTFAELRLDAQSLAARPDGTPFGPNDSVLITMRVPSTDEILVELSPTGIRFANEHGAELRLRYDETHGDLNGDGDDDHRDDDIERVLAIWRQENPGDPFVKIGTIKTDNARELRAFLKSFSRYAISY